MPRTKSQQATNTTKSQQAIKTNKENINATIKQENTPMLSREKLTKMWLLALEQELKLKRLEIKYKMNAALDAINNMTFDELTACVAPSKENNTIGELLKENTFAINGTCGSDLGKSILKNTTIFKSFNSTANNTFANTGRKKKQTEDEGYLTAGDSGRSVSTDRASRSTSRQVTKKTRASRSLSRPKAAKNVTIQASSKKTPIRQMIPPNSYGFVTPKMKPNTPLSILRRPKQGEMAISMQGSPLLVSGVITETCANVNIPLEDGRILSLQPSRSLRMSEIPNLDEVTRQQLLTLRDNLSKVVKLANEC